MTQARGAVVDAGTGVAASGSLSEDLQTMNPTIVKPVADPFDDIDRVTPIDTLMARQDRADLPGNRSDQPGNDENDPDRNELGADPIVEGEVDGDALAESLSDEDIDPDLDLAIDPRGARSGTGPDDDEPIEETERMGDDSLTGPG
jgi:hypothetical protein